MIARIASKIGFAKSTSRSFAAIWPPTKGSKVVNSLENVFFT